MSTPTDARTLARIIVRVSADQRAIAVIPSDLIDFASLEVAVAKVVATIPKAVMKKVWFRTDGESEELDFGPACVVRLPAGEKAAEVQANIVKAADEVVKAMFSVPETDEGTPGDA